MNELSIFHTSLTGHEIFGLVFAEVETAGQNHIIVVALRKIHGCVFRVINS